MVRVFIPWKLPNGTNESCFYLEPVVSHLAAHHWVYGMVRLFYIKGHYANGSLGPTACLDRRKWVRPFLPNLQQPFSHNGYLTRSSVSLQGPSGLATKGLALVGIFDLKPQLTAPVESEVLKRVRGLEKCQVLLSLLLHCQVMGSKEDLQYTCIRRRVLGCHAPSLALVIDS